MTFVAYAARVAVHPDRYGAKKTQGPDLWLVVHTSEGGEGDNAAENLASFLTAPGDRPSGIGASYHAIADTGMRIIPAVPADTVAYAAAGGNARGRHICIPGRVSQTREQWLDPVSRSAIGSVAGWLADQAAEITADHPELGPFPLRRLTVEQVRAGERGYCGHHDISKAFGKSTHTDPEPNFPWDVLADDLAAITTPTPEPPIGDLMGLEFVPQTDEQRARVLDTRKPATPAAGGNQGRPLASDGTPITVPAHRAGPPAGARAVAVNITADQTAGPGFLTAWSFGPRPEKAVVNYRDPGDARNGFTIVPLSGFGTFELAAAVNAAHAQVDVAGWFVDPEA